ncbi:hypothetical protein PITCH_A1580020 [uncultured Desulfobacterium sp.]|uniref:Uncharacterized protein n=1 Tax=uncultured Desulfobacterium sp. TaxID=201089 RepID=A0A445MTT6_9BACT|nr:hypothetical protein PITCH_A1580020 [uncultured Desulfobacterium sp.]
MEYGFQPEIQFLVLTFAPILFYKNRFIHLTLSPQGWKAHNRIKRSDKWHMIQVRTRSFIHGRMTRPA